MLGKQISESLVGKFLQVFAAVAGKQVELPARFRDQANQLALRRGCSIFSALTTCHCEQFSQYGGYDGHCTQCTETDLRAPTRIPRDWREVMTVLSMENPVFVTYMIAGAIMILKLIGQGWMTVLRMLKADAGFVTPEDLQAGPINRNPDLLQIPAFLACGLLFVAAGPSYLLANILMYSFVGARLLHTLAFATKQRREVRATLYTIGPVVVIIMALYVLAVAIF